MNVIPLQENRDTITETYTAARKKEKSSMSFIRYQTKQKLEYSSSLGYRARFAVIDAITRKKISVKSVYCPKTVV